jgi:hypothetical protein
MLFTRSTPEGSPYQIGGRKLRKSYIVVHTGKRSVEIDEEAVF